jgi:ABC-type hemin transport system substrate-binding protein
LSPSSSSLQLGVRSYTACHARVLTISGKDHHDDFTTKIIKVSTLSTREKKALILAKCHDQELKVLAMIEEVII